MVSGQNDLIIISGADVTHGEQAKMEAMKSQSEMGGEKGPKLLEQVRRKMRLHHYSIHTERSYSDWIKRYIRFHQMESREDLADGERKIEAFLTDLAVNGKVSPST